MIEAEIRAMAATDWVALAPLMQRFNEGEGIVWRPEAMRRAFEQLTAESALGFGLVALADGSPIAYLIVTYSFDLEWSGRDAFLTEIYVAPQARRHGLAGRLLGRAEARAHDSGAHALHLAVLPANASAMALYRRAGFEAVPRTMMTKPLTGGAVVEKRR
jgi:ribosomal protein S18 acetylase RimI-like enzyme